jgi:hypothetical protein
VYSFIKNGSSSGIKFRMKIRLNTFQMYFWKLVIVIDSEASFILLKL